MGKLIVRLVWVFAATIIGFSFRSFAGNEAQLTEQAAAHIFAEAKTLSDKDGGHLWGKTLYGPILLVNPQTRALFANEPDTQGLLRKSDDIYAGSLPETVTLANTPTEWAGKHWTMLLWPLPPDHLTREVMLAHEMFHRVQPSLQLDAEDMPNLQLDTAEGRTLIQLEWRALSVALTMRGAAQLQAIRDALAFRAERQRIFAGARRTEASLEIAEGVPEYSGTMVAAPDAESARWRAIAKLTDPDLSISFVRAFAYTSGPPYGMLLDERMPDWRKKLTRTSDLGALLAATLPQGPHMQVNQRALRYGVSEIRKAESERTARLAAQVARYRAMLVDGPVLLLPAAGHFNFSFNPSTLVSLGDAGAVYPTFHATDDWGTLDVTDGVRIPTDFSSATVAAPADSTGSHIVGPGWTLDLAEGWHLVNGARPGCYIVRKYVK